MSILDRFIVGVGCVVCCGVFRFATLIRFGSVKLLLQSANRLCHVPYLLYQITDMQTITWGQLFLCLFIFLLCYYAAVLGLYYRAELVAIAGRFNMGSGGSESKDDVEEEPQERVTIYDEVRAVMEASREVFKRHTESPLNKDQLIEDLRAAIRKYPKIKGTSYETSLTNYIEQEVDHRFSTRLSDEELEGIWR